MSEGELRKQIYLLLPLCQGEEYKHCTPEHPSSICQRAVGGIMEIIAQQCAAARKECRDKMIDALRVSVAPTQVGEILAIYDHFHDIVPTPKADQNNHNAPDGAEREV